MQIERLQLLLIKSDRGLLTADEEFELAEWYMHLKQNDADLSFIESDEASLESTLWSRISVGLEEREQRPPRRRLISFPLSRTFWFYGAASVAFLLGIFWGTVHLLQETGVNKVSYATSIGERKEINLPDGSKVWLGPSSTLQFPEEFGDSVRAISLSGEAFFSVTEDKRHPFVVHAGELTTRVLGTTFNVQSYPDDESINVILATGKVNVRSSGGVEKALLPDQRLVYSRKQNVASIEMFPEASRKLQARKAGILEYNDTPVRLIVDDLNRLHKAGISVKGDLDRCTYYGTLGADDNLDTFLEELCYLIRAKLVKTANGFEIYPEGCS